MLSFWIQRVNNFGFREASKEAAKYVADQGEDITDIAVLWTLALENIPTTLISTASVVNMTRIAHCFFQIYQLITFTIQIPSWQTKLA